MAIDWFLLLVFTGVLLMIIGFLLLVLSSFIETASRAEESRVEAGGVIIVGPIPLVLATSTRIALILLILAIILTVLAIVAYVVIAKSVVSLIHAP